MKLREYQERAVERILAATCSEKKENLLVVAPTGAGKTVIARAAIQQLVDRNAKIMFVAHRKELIEQAADKVETSGVAYGVIKAGDPRKRPWCDVQVASVQTISPRLKRATRFCIKPEFGCLPSDIWKPDVIIIDEAHRSLAKQYVQLEEFFPQAVIIGLTATPVRTDNRGLGDMYDRLYVVEYVSKLIADGFLMKPRNFIPKVSEAMSLQIKKKGGSDYDHEKISDEMRTRDIHGDIIKEWNDRAYGYSTIGFAPTVEMSKEFAERFNAAGISSDHVDGSMRKDKRESIINAYKDDKFKVLWNVDVLTEGFDHPAAACCLMARPTMSESKFLQMIGRIMRLYEGKPTPILIDFVANIVTHGGGAHIDRGWTLDTTKEKKKKEKRPRVCSHCGGVSDPGATHCDLCGKPFSTKGSLERVGPQEVAGDMIEMLDCAHSCAKCKSNNTIDYRDRAKGPFMFSIKCFECGHEWTFEDKTLIEKASTSVKAEFLLHLYEQQQLEQWPAKKMDALYYKKFGQFPSGVVRQLARLSRSSSGFWQEKF